MRSSRATSALGPIQTLLDLGPAGAATDGQLLERFATGRGEGAERAFEALVDRHGSMVFRVCRGLLDDPNDADDAFQATFLVLARRARSLWVDDSIGPWLHQVAHRTARCARSAAARRRRLERASALAVIADTSGPPDPDLSPLLLEELARLDRRDRDPIVLCDLEGRTHQEAARHLGVPVGTVKSRLSRARDRLRARLVRRGVAPGSAPLAGLARAVGPVPTALIRSTLTAAIGPATPGPVGSILAREVLTMMTTLRWVRAASGLLVGVAAASGIGRGRGRIARGGGPGRVAAADDGPTVVAVRSGPFRSRVIERGVVEASRVGDVVNPVADPTVVLSILPDGSRVKKGDKVAELDNSTLRDRHQNQAVTVAQASTLYLQARLVREVAEFAIPEAVATAKAQVADARDRVEAARSAVTRAEARLGRIRRAADEIEALRSTGRAPRTAADLLAAVQVADLLDSAEEAQRRDGRALERAVADEKAQADRLSRIEAGTDRTAIGLKSELEKTRADELSKRAAFEGEKARLDRLARMIEASVLHAPVDGVVSRVERVSEGETVRERQILLKVVDLDAPMRVNAQVHESIVDRLVEGMKAEVTIDAFPGQTFPGLIRSVAPVPDPTTHLASKVKIYPTRITLDAPPPGLRPGMTARVDVVVAEVASALTIPVSAVLPFGGRDRVAVRGPDGSFDLRDVTLGLADETAVVVKSGLAPGDSVATDPRALLDARPGLRPK